MIPLIPIAVGARWVNKMVQIDRNNAKSDSINIKALNRMEESQRLMWEQQNKTEMSLEKLANRKKGILITSIKEFIELYEKIMTINFEEGDGINELSVAIMAPQLLKNMRSMSTSAGFSMSTGQLIATFIIKGSISGVMVKESEMNITAAQIRKKQANVITSQAETIKVAIDAVYQRAERISELLAKLNLLFRKSIETTRAMINEKGKNRLSYSNKEKEYIMVCINIASAMKNILDTPLLDENGEITIRSMEAIDIGEEYLQKIKKVID